MTDVHPIVVVHPDIKPENILLQGGHALVVDFGIALAVRQAGGQRMTQTGLSLGTPQYMAPKQAMGDKHIDRRADAAAARSRDQGMRNACRHDELAADDVVEVTNVRRRSVATHG